MASPRSAHIAWSGDVDLSNVATVKSEIDEVTSPVDLQGLIIDLSGLQFIDSLGLGLLVYARERCLLRGVGLQLANTPQATRHLLRVAGLDVLFALD